MSFLCGLSWTLYGYLLGDKFVFIPNLLATILGLIQLTLFVLYPIGKDRIDRKEIV